MNKSHHRNVFTIGIGGAAGDGVREAGSSLGQLLNKLGYEVFISNTYPSLIRGGHNFTRVSFAKDHVWCDHTKLDLLIALNEETVKLHMAELHNAEDHPQAVIFADDFDLESRDQFGKNAVTLPMSVSAEGLKASPITRNSVALGAACYLMNLDYSVMQKILADVFKDKQQEANIKLADIGYEHMKKLGFSHPKIGSLDFSDPVSRDIEKLPKELIDGNTALGKGLLSAGLDFYVGYPMTPITGLLHFMANRKTANDIKVIQPESEISVINMALGIAYAGKRVAIGSATGGFMLMQEAFSLSGMAELPLVVAVAERQAPATGVPTFSSQTDLQLVIHSGHGEFPRIVIAPGDSEEAFLVGANALNLAWRYQLPVIVLMDKILCEHSSTSFLDTKSIKVENGTIVDSGVVDSSYGRYEITKNGISPMAFPGTSNAIVKVTSYEHDSRGITTEEIDLVKTMADKRWRKGETLLKELKDQETVKVYGDANAKNVVVFWGSTKGPVLEAAKYFDQPVKLLQILWMEPFDVDGVIKQLKGAVKIVNIECNHNAQMASLIRQKTGIQVTDNILKYDSRPFDPIDLAIEINKILY
jgi:2-oxoglutarate/2-oxoacid ferredoxin oxidoreductase subunit alpha